jgi:hypothetical protein
LVKKKAASPTNSSSRDLQRLPDWRSRLDAYLDWIEGQAFDWQVMSCGLFAAGCVQAVTGVDFAQDYVGAVKDAETAAKALAERGFETITDLAAAKLPECPVASLRMGDIASVALSTGPTLYLVSGSFLTGVGRRGKVTLPLTKADRGFRVG